MAKQSTFGIGIGEIFSKGFKAWLPNFLPLMAAGILPVAVSTGFSQFANQFIIENSVAQDVRFFIFNFIGWVIAGTLSYPWYVYAIRAADGDPIRLGEPFETPKKFLQQFVGTFWFFAGFVLGIRFFLLPAFAILVFYAFYGYLIADTDKGGLHALGTSVRMGEKRRFGLFALSMIFMMFNFLGVVPGLGLEGLSFSVRLVVVSLGLLVTTSITLVCGAVIYRVFRGFLNE